MKCSLQTYSPGTSLTYNTMTAPPHCALIAYLLWTRIDRHNHSAIYQNTPCVDIPLSISRLQVNTMNSTGGRVAIQWGKSKKHKNRRLSEVVSRRVRDIVCVLAHIAVPLDLNLGSGVPARELFEAAGCA